MDDPGVHIFLRPLGSPLTLGLSGLSIASLVQSGLDLGWVRPRETAFAGLILIAVPFVLQLVASLLAYLARDGATGAALGVLATTWLAMGLIHLVSGSSAPSGALGLLLVAAGGTLAISSAVAGSAKPLTGLVFTLAAARFAVAGVHQLSGAGAWKDAAGILGLVVTATAAYAVLAFELEGAYHRAILPTFRIGRGRLAVSGDTAERIDGLTDEAGVRQLT
ncbi:MAG: hypothetical protein ACRDMJ_17700 [Solirubrobacteraceae bacterium]